MATSKRILRLFKQAHEIITRVDNGSRDEREVARQFQEILDESSPLLGIRPDQLYASPFSQYQALKRWNQQLQLGLPEAAIEAAYDEMPGRFHRHGIFTPTTLCWTLADVDTTVKAKLKAASLVYGDTRPDPHICEEGRVALSERMSQARYRLVDGAPPFIPNRVGWETHQLDHGRDLRPSQVPPDKAAGIQVLDIIIQHRVYVGLQDGRRIPYLDTPGLRVDVPTHWRAPDAWGPWHFVLFLKGGQEHGGWDNTHLHIGTTGYDYMVYRDFAEPIIVA